MFPLPLRVPPRQDLLRSYTLSFAVDEIAFLEPTVNTITQGSDTPLEMWINKM